MSKNKKVVNIDSYLQITGVDYVGVLDLEHYFGDHRRCGTVVTAPSDLGVKYNNPGLLSDVMTKDMLLNIEYYVEQFQKSDGMSPIYFKPRCAVPDCKSDDEYALGIDNFVYCTSNFQKPSGVKWFASNINVSMGEGFTHVPFGVNNTNVPDVPDEYGVHIWKNGKYPQLYLNFSEHTLQRKHLNNHFEQLNPVDDSFGSYTPWVTVVRKADPNEPGLPYEEYVEDMKSHTFILCPSGIGFDTYRLWEALAFGATPVLQKDHWNEWMTDLFPVLLVDDFFDIDNISYLMDRMPDRASYDTKYLSEDYWRELIKESL